VEIVEGSGDAGDERDASSLGIAEEPVLAGIAPIQRPANILPTAVRAAVGEVVDLPHLGSVTASGRVAAHRETERQARAPIVVRFSGEISVAPRFCNAPPSGGRALDLVTVVGCDALTSRGAARSGAAKLRPTARVLPCLGGGLVS